MDFYSDNRGPTLGDILALRAQPPVIEIVLHAPKGMPNGKIYNIKALRGATQDRTKPDSYGGWSCMGLAQAKGAIEAIMDYGSVRLQMSPANYGCFMVNRHGLSQYDWQVKSSEFVEPRPEIPVFKI